MPRTDSLPQPAIGDARLGRRLVLAALSVTRPLVVVTLALVSILGACRTYGSTVSSSYEPRSYHASGRETPPPKTLAADDPNSPDSNAVPLLFLSFVGLAGMALSRTGASRERREETISSEQKIAR